MQNVKIITENINKENEIENDCGVHICSNSDYLFVQ